MKKKIYIAPKLTRIKMVMAESVLSVCHVSPQRNPARFGRTCSMELSCFEEGVLIP